MCGPVTIAYAALTAFMMYSQQQEKKSARESAASAQRYNARQNENEATRTLNKGVEQELKHRRAVAELQSEQRAKLGASGIELTSGSAEKILEETVDLGEVDALRIRSNYRDQAGALGEAAVLKEGKARALEQGGQLDNLALIGGVASSVAGVSQKWGTK